jgi:hypothetical protein
MQSSLGLVLKVILASAALSWGIKYIGPQLSVPATSIVALVVVLTPPLVVAGLLGWRLWRNV